MAALQGILDTGRSQVSRLAHKIIDATLRTQNDTRATVTMRNDGSGWINVRRGRESFRLEWSSESKLVKGSDGTPELTDGKLRPELFVGYDGTPAHKIEDCTDTRVYEDKPQ